MEVILTEDVVGVGDIGERVRVKPGYARNFLIPRGCAVEVASSSVKRVSHMMRQIEAKKGRLKGGAEDKARELERTALEFTVRMGSGGKIFGSISNRDIAARFVELGFNIERRRVLLAEPIKGIGNFKVQVKLHPEVVANVTINVTPVSATKEDEAEETEGARQALEESTTAEEGLEEGAEADSEPIENERSE